MVLENTYKTLTHYSNSSSKCKTENNILISSSESSVSVEKYTAVECDLKKEV